MTILSEEQIRRTPKAARLTPPGRGAVAVVKLLGDPALIDATPALFIAANKKSLAEQPIDRIVYGHWYDEDIVVCRTGELQTEICCHGGHAAVNRILDDLSARGVEIVDGFDLVSLEHSTFQTECQKALSEAATLKAVNVILEQSSGIVENRVAELHQLAEKQAWQSIIEELQKWKSRFDFGKHLTTPWKVALIGRPNVGKSSLLNRLLGFDRAIVFDQPGTTRDLVSAKTAYDGWAIEFTDTAGLRETENEIETVGIAKAIEQVMHSDLTILLLDASAGLTDDDRRLLDKYPDAFVVWNKSDQLPELSPELKAISTTSISALKNEGIEQLLGEIVNRLVPQPPTENDVVPFTERQQNIVEQIINTCGNANSEKAIELLDRYLHE